jgi:hypothetical protein
VTPTGPAQLRARLGAAFTAHLSPEHTRRATLFERLTVQRLSWDVLVRIHRYLELVGKLATGIWVGFVASVLVGVNWKFVVEGVFNSGTRIRDALALTLLLGTGVFLLARSTVGFLRWRVQRELWRRDVERFGRAGITPAG